MLRKAELEREPIASHIAGRRHDTGSILQSIVFLHNALSENNFERRDMRWHYSLTLLVLPASRGSNDAAFRPGSHTRR